MMKISRTLGVILCIAAVLLTAATAISYFIYEAGRIRAHNEKWEDYIDCGRA